MYISRARQKKGWFFCFCFLAIARLERSPFVCQFMYFLFAFESILLFFHSIVSGRLSGTFSTVDVYTMSFFFAYDEIYLQHQQQSKQSDLLPVEYVQCLAVAAAIAQCHVHVQVKVNRTESKLINYLKIQLLTKEKDGSSLMLFFLLRFIHLSLGLFDEFFFHSRYISFLLLLGVYTSL